MSKKPSIIAQLRALRIQRGMTQQELADKAGTTRQWIVYIESGKSSPSLATLKPIIKALNAELLLKDNSAMIKKYTNGYEAWYIDKHPHGRIFRSEDYCPKADKDESIVLLTEYWSVVVYLKNLIELEEMEAKLKLKVKE